MARTRPKERTGKRVLTDDEICDVWKALACGAESLPSCYPAYIWTLLLTAVRRTEAARVAWQETKQAHRGDYSGIVWTVPAARMKNKLDHAVPLTSAVLALVGERPKDANARPHVFSTVGGITPFSGYSKADSLPIAATSHTIGCSWTPNGKLGVVATARKADGSSNSRGYSRLCGKSGRSDPEVNRAHFRISVSFRTSLTLR